MTRGKSERLLLLGHGFCWDLERFPTIRGFSPSDFTTTDMGCRLVRRVFRP